MIRSARDSVTAAGLLLSADLFGLLLAVGLVVVDRAVNAYRWVVLLRALTPGSRPPLTAVMHIFFVS